MSEQNTRLATRQELLETIEDLVRQFAYSGSIEGVPAYTTGGLSALEDAFDVLGWNDPQPCPENQCEYPGCSGYADSGTPTPNGYKRCCYKHFGAYSVQEKG